MKLRLLLAATGVGVPDPVNGGCVKPCVDHANSKGGGTPKPAAGCGSIINLHFNTWGDS
jgi:hypothetical protein